MSIAGILPCDVKNPVLSLLFADPARLYGTYER
jgi:hypothetical protein